MHWVTRTDLHLDRVATPWLIARFVDSEATFGFVPSLEDVPAGDGVVPFGFPGIEFSSHDQDGSCFGKVLRRYGLSDPALGMMERLVASGISDALGTEPPVNMTADEAALGFALNKIGFGMSLALDDEQHLRAGLSLYDGLYALCQVTALGDGPSRGVPTDHRQRPASLREEIHSAAQDPGNASP